MGTAAPGFPRSHPAGVPDWHAGARAIVRPAASADRSALPDAAGYPGLVKAAIVVGGSLALWAGAVAALLLALG